MPLGLDQGVGAVVWSPLGWGRLTGKIRRGQPLPKVSRLHKTADNGPQVADEYLYRVVDALDEVAAQTGKSVPQIALNWLLQRPTVSTVIIGARNEEQLQAESRRGRLDPDAGADRNAGRGERRSRSPIPIGTSASVFPSAIRRRCERRAAGRGALTRTFAVIPVEEKESAHSFPGAVS